MKLSQVPVTAIQKVLLYGPPKSGKTQLVGNLVEKYNLIWFDFENGYKTLQKLPLEYQERIEYIRIPDTKDWPVAIETALKVIKGAETKICNEHGKVGCTKCIRPGVDPTTYSTVVTLSETPKDAIVVFDSLSQVAISAMSNILKNQPDDYKPEWEDYRRQGFLLEKLLTNIQQANYNVVCIGHDIDVSKDDRTVKLSAQAGTTNFSRNVGKFFDHMIYCEIKTKKHVFGSSTTYSSLALTGSRLDISMEDMEVPSLIPIFDGSWLQHLEELQNAQAKKILSQAARVTPQVSQVGSLVKK